MCKDGKNIPKPVEQEITCNFPFVKKNMAKHSTSWIDVRATKKPTSNGVSNGALFGDPWSCVTSLKCDPPLRVAAWKLHVEVTLKALPNLGAFGIQRIRSNADIFAANSGIKFFD